MKFGGRSLAWVIFPANIEARIRMVVAKIGWDRDFLYMRSDFGIALRLDGGLFTGIGTILFLIPEKLLGIFCERLLI